MGAHSSEMTVMHPTASGLAGPTPVNKRVLMLLVMTDTCCTVRLVYAHIVCLVWGPS